MLDETHLGQEGRKDNEHILGFKIFGKVGEDVDANGLVGNEFKIMDGRNDSPEMCNFQTQLHVFNLKE